MLWPKRSDGGHHDTVSAGETVFTCACRHHKETGFWHGGGVDFVGELYQVGSTFFDESVPSQLDFDEPVSAIPQVKDRITLKPSSVAEVEHIAIEGVCVYAEVSYAHTFKQQSKSLEVFDEAGWPDS